MRKRGSVLSQDPRRLFRTGRAKAGGHGFSRAAVSDCQNARKIAASAAEVTMSKPPRDRTSFGSNVYFVTASTQGHRSLFQTERMAGLFIDTIFHYRRERKFLLHEFVVMPIHFHLLLTPSEITLERALQFIKGGFSYYAAHVGYIRQNPVEGKIVSRAEDYLYSSAHGRFELDSCPRELARVYAVAR